MISEFENCAREAVKRMWHQYCLHLDSAEFLDTIRHLPHDLLVIGTGRHELYEDLQAFQVGMSADQLEGQDIQFELVDEWYSVQAITDNVCVVYGSLWVREHASPDKMAIVYMNGSRFTVVCRKTQEGIEICSIHHSMPYDEQADGEYYPKTLSSLADEALRKSCLLECKVEQDSLTELLNRVYMEKHVGVAMKNGQGFFFMLDLDDFKRINDTLGHLIGDEVIRSFAGLLRDVFSRNALIGRMGGDEFAVWDDGIFSVNEAEERFQALLTGCQKLSAQIGCTVSCTAGIAQAGRECETFRELFRRTDRALYLAKSAGKKQAYWA